MPKISLATQRCIMLSKVQIFPCPSPLLTRPADTDLKEKILKRLLDHKDTDVTITNNDDNTALHYGAKRCVSPGFAPYFEAILKKGNLLSRPESILR